jgi:hypothetical protein
METISKKPLREIAASAPPKLKEKLADLAMSEGILGRRELLEAAAVLSALKPQSESERDASLAVLRQIGIDTLDSTFYNLLRLGEVSIESLGSFVDLKSELSPLSQRPSGIYPKEQAPKAFTSWNQLDDDQALERAQSIITRNSVSDQAELQKVYKGVFVEMHRRGLLDSLTYVQRPEPAQLPPVTLPKTWQAMEDEEVLERAQEVIRRESLPSLSDLGNRYRGINFELFRRGIADHLNFSCSA